MKNRRDAKRIKMDGLHNLVWHIKPNRCDSDVYINFKVDVTELKKYIEKKKIEDDKITYFHAFSAAIAKTVSLRPLLNRFLLNSHYYERNEISLAFVAKTEFKDNAPEFFAYLKADPTDNIDNIKEKIYDKVNKIRSSEKNEADDLIEKVGRMPRFIRAFVIWLLKTLDNYDLLPKSLVENDIYHSTILISNLGSIKCGAIYHNLTDFGTNSILMTVGEIKKEPVIIEDKIVIHDVCEFGINLDERIADGAYFAKSMNLFKYILENPKLLEEQMNENIKNF